MMAESAYDDWLCEKLRSLQLDDDVFLDYLKGVLDEDSSSEEKAETIENILQGATVIHIARLRYHVCQLSCV